MRQVVADPRRPDPAADRRILVEDRDHWLFTTMTPGESPMARLAAGFETAADVLRERGAEAIVEQLSRHPEAGSRNCLLLVDQFEELFRFAASSRDEAADFVSILLALAEQRDFSGVRGPHHAVGLSWGLRCL